jgi:hypothetical protein
MSRRWQALGRHALVLAAVTAGIAGMSLLFSGAMQGNLREVSRGMPLLLIGLWWAGRELGRSIQAGRHRYSRGSRRSTSSLRPAKPPGNERVRGDT